METRGLPLCGAPPPARQLIPILKDNIALNTLLLARVGLGRDQDAENVSVAETELAAPGMVCEACAQMIAHGLRALEGVRKALSDV